MSVVERAAVAVASRPLPDGLADELLACLDESSGLVQRAAADELVRLSAVEPLIEARLRDRLDAAHAATRRAAAFTLARLGGRAARLVPVLIEALGDPVSEVRWSAHHALALIREQRASVLPALVAAARDAVPLRRRMALYGLRDWGAPAAEVEGLVLGGLADLDPTVRLAALALASHDERGTEAVRDAVLGALAGDAVHGVRRAATAALARMAASGSDAACADLARGALERAARDPDPRMRKAARAALRLIEHASA